jgi:carboxymethylenebutenolidase
VTVLNTTVPVSHRRPLQGALAVPDGAGPHPGVVVLHEAFGLNDDMRRICERFAREGYAALAPDLYSYSSAPKAVCLTRTMLDSTGERGTLDRIEATRQALADRPDVDEARIGVIGFCMGGGFALLFAARGGVKVAGVNYGKVPKDRDRLAGVCPVVASYGGRDRMFRDDARRLERYLTDLGVPHDVKVYDDVGHSFMNKENGPSWMLRLPSPMQVGYSEPEAEDAWRRILSFFGEHL